MTVAIYARYSSDLSRDASIEDQVRLCRAFAERNGWIVSSVHEDRAISGASAIRPGYQALLEAVSEGRITVVLAEALDRLSRDQEDIAALFKRLRFLGVKLITVSEGEISDLHIGLKGAMNALYLKDLADKTRRGLEGRVRAGRSGGGLCYGYDVVPGAERGGREINDREAAIVRRVFREFAAGRSPKAIAKQLNADGIPGPRSKMWRDTAIRGHRQRGTGMLNNELYIGRLIWNRLRYVKDPRTGRRVSRANPPEAWVIEEVPQLRIIDEDLWQAVKSAQQCIDDDPRVKAIKESRFWEHRRAEYLLTGRVFCAHCAGTFAAVGRDYLACSNARKLGTCDQRKGLRRNILEDFVLELVRDRLMQPDAVAAFTAAYHKEINAGRNDAQAERDALARTRRTLQAKLDGLYDAIADGLRTPGLLAKVETLEGELRKTDEELDRPAPSPIRLHPNLADHYRQRVSELSAALRDPATGDEARAMLRKLIARVDVSHGPAGWTVTLEGEITQLIQMGMAAQDGSGHRSHLHALRSVKVVAGVGFEPTTFRL